MVDEVGYDAIVVGGGFAGLTAALWWGAFAAAPWCSRLVLPAMPTRVPPTDILVMTEPIQPSFWRS